MFSRWDSSEPRAIPELGRWNPEWLTSIQKSHRQRSNLSPQLLKRSHPCPKEVHGCIQLVEPPRPIFSIRAVMPDSRKAIPTNPSDSVPLPFRQDHWSKETHLSNRIASKNYLLASWIRVWILNLRVDPTQAMHFPFFPSPKRAKNHRRLKRLAPLLLQALESLSAWIFPQFRGQKNPSLLHQGLYQLFAELSHDPEMQPMFAVGQY